MKNTAETQKETWQAPEITDLDVKKTEGKDYTPEEASSAGGPS